MMKIGTETVQLRRRPPLQRSFRGPSALNESDVNTPSRPPKLPPYSRPSNAARPILTKSSFTSISFSTPFTTCSSKAAATSLSAIDGTPASPKMPGCSVSSK